MSERLCTIYRSSKKEGMYLYVDRTEDLERMPDELLKFFGKPVFSMTLLIGSDKKLARANAVDVLKEIDEKGFYMQMPPTLFDEEASERKPLVDKNTKLSR